MSYKSGPSSLAEFELLVLLAALRLGPEESYTVSIADDIQQRTGRSVRRANVYTTLQRLEAKRLVTTELGEPRPERGGKPRRLVTVRPAGVAAVRATTDAIRAMVGELDGIIGETT
jgi:PadR family transcriptional regulator, regulatory protein PadR